MVITCYFMALHGTAMDGNGARCSAGICCDTRLASLGCKFQSSSGYLVAIRQILAAF